MTAWLSIVATLTTMSACSAQSIEVDELTDAALQIDGTVMYVYGTDLDDWVFVQPHPTQVNHVRVQILDLDDVVLAEHHYSMASLEAIIVSLGAGADTYSNTTTERDIVYGGTGGDTIYGGKGISWLYGEGGEDTVYGDLGNDVIDGGENSDVIGGGWGNDILIGGTGNDTLSDDMGDDWMFGGAGSDHLISGFGDSLLYGEGDGDTIDRDLDDTAWGGPGIDTITAGVV